MLLHDHNSMDSNSENMTDECRNSIAMQGKEQRPTYLIELAQKYVDFSMYLQREERLTACRKSIISLCARGFRAMPNAVSIGQAEFRESSVFFTVK